MSLYRVKQFYWAVFAHLKEKHNAFINSILNNEELSLFKALSINEQLHCIRVTKDVINQLSILKDISIDRKELLIKAAMLHDVGKAKCPLNVMDKSILVLTDKLTNGKLKKYSKYRKIHIYYYHAEEGAKILESKGYDKRLIYLIRNHHNYNIEDFDLNILRTSDNRN